MSVVANVAINVDSRNAVSKLREVQAQAATTERAFNGVTAAAGKLATAFGALQAFKFVFAKTAELESQTRSLEVLTGSAEKAGKIIKELQQLGAVTPFTSTELIDSAKRLQAFGVEADKVVETTKRLADVSGATGAELQGLVTAYGQVQAKGRLQGEELLQFQERGVALQEELRKMYGLSGEEFQKALSKGRVSAEAVEVAIIRLTNAGGKYANGAIAQSDTLQGKLSTLQDSIDGLAREIGKTLSPVISEVITDLTELANSFVSNLQFMKQQYKNFLADLRGQDTGTLQQQIGDLDKMIATNQGQLKGASPYVEKLVQNKIKELRKLRSSLQKDLDQKLGLVAPAGQSTVLPQRQAAPATLALLPETEKKKRGDQLNINDLLGGEIQRQLQERQAKLAEATAKMMNTAAASENPQQAQRMVEYSSKLLGIKYQIAAADDTINKREGFRAEYLSRAADKAQEALAFDEGTNNLKTARRNLETEINTLLAEQTGKAEAQYRQQQQAINEVLAGLDMEKLKLQANTDVKKQAIQFLEIENQLKSQGITLSNQQADAVRRIIAENNTLSRQQEAAKKQAEFIKAQYEAIGSSIGDQLVGVFDNLITKTKDWNNVLSDALMSIGRVLMMAGLNMMAGSDGKGILSFLGFGARANGGPVTGGAPYLVGERGPELFVPNASGNVVSNADTRAALAQQAAGRQTNDTRAMLNQQTANRQMNAGSTAVQQKPIEVKYESTVINGVEYVTAEQHQRGIALAAERGRSLTLQTLQNSVKTRKRVGMA